MLFQTSAFIIILEYDFNNNEDFFVNLKSIYKEFVRERQRFIDMRNRHYLAHARSTSFAYSPPLLVLLSIDTSDIPSHTTLTEEQRNGPNDDLATENTDSDSVGSEDLEIHEKVYIDTAVHHTHQFVSELIASDKAAEVAATTTWYIQPIDRNSIRPPWQPLKNGVYSAVNWMVRALEAQNSNLLASQN